MRFSFQRSNQHAQPTHVEVSAVLRLYLDAHHGLSGIPCPACGQALLPAVQRMGTLLVAYDGQFRARPGSRAMLVCPSYHCDHQEPILIARTSADAVPYSAIRASERWKHQADFWAQSPKGLRDEIRRLEALFRETGRPKLRSAIRCFEWHYQSVLAELTEQVEAACEDEMEVIWTTDDAEEKGRVLALMHDGVLFERSGSGQTLVLPLSDLLDITYIDDEAFFTAEPVKVRFDFGGRPGMPADVHQVYGPRRFVVVDGHALILDFITRYQVVRVKTTDEAAAKALGLWKTHGESFVGEFPVGLVERSFRLVQHCHVQGHRLHFESDTNHPDIVCLSTRRLEVAQALHLSRRRRSFASQKGLHWSGFFYRHEITRWEELQATTGRPRYRRRRKFRFQAVT